jgi:adenylate kinase
MEKPIIFFIGKPGSGKGTQAKLLADVTGWPVVGTSGGMRELVAEGGTVGHKIRETMDAGLLMPYWIASYIYLKILFGLKEDSNVIFDGTSRTLPEAEIVSESLVWLGRPFHIFYLHVPDEEVHTRINLRKEKEARKDDHMVHKRLEEYYASTEAAVDLYRKAGVLTEIDGHRPPEIIAAEVRTILKL